MVEWIGFIISFFALIYLFSKQNSRTGNQTHPSRYPNKEAEEENPFVQFLGSLEKEAEARESIQRLPPHPPSHPSKGVKKSKKAYSSFDENQVQSQNQQRHVQNILEERRLKSRFNPKEELTGRMLISPARPLLDEEVISRPSRIQLALQRLSSRKDLIIYQEIMDKPKSMRL